MFDKYVDIKEEIRKILEPSLEDTLSKSVKGALKMAIQQQGGKITHESAEKAIKQIVTQLRNGQNL